MTTSFTDMLRVEAEPTWTDAVQHRFIRELCDGSVSDAVMGAYLVQDSRFLGAFLMLLGGAMASAETGAARLRFGRFAGVVAGEENSYFERCFDALGLDLATREAMPDSAPTAGFKAIMREAAESLSYPAILAVLNVAEGLYLDWAARAPRPLPDNFIHAEWVTLHNSPDFRDFVAFLRGELDRVGPAQADIARDFFLRAVVLERDFFDAAYDPAFHLGRA